MLELRCEKLEEDCLIALEKHCVGKSPELEDLIRSFFGNTRERTLGEGGGILGEGGASFR